MRSDHSEMAFCESCGSAAAVDARFCPYCGALQHSASDDAASRSVLLQVEVRSRGRVWVLAGGIGVAAAPFLTWVHVVVLGDLNLFNLLDAGKTPEGWATIPMLLGLASAAAAYFRARWLRRLAIPSALIAGGADALLLIALPHDVRQTYGLAQVRLGPWIGVGGAVAMLLGAARRPSSA
jgi:hypothetical protein